MKIAAIAFATLALLAGAGADVKSFVRTMYSKADQDLRTKNLDGFAKLLRANVTSDFKSTDMGQTEDFDHMITEIKGAFGSMKRITKCSTAIQKTVVNSKTATFATRRTMAGIVVMPDGKTHTMSNTMNSKDVWIHVGSGWKLQSMTWSDEKMTLDGKPFNPGAMAPPKSK